MVKIPLMIVPRKHVSEEHHSILIPNHQGPVFKSQGKYNLVCSKCDKIIGENVPNLTQFVNVITRCSKCSSYLLLTEQYAEKDFPPIERYLKQNVKTQASFVEYSTNQHIRESLDRAQSAIYLKGKSKQNFPKVLYHYTSLEGLKGIIEGGSIWSSDPEYLNDQSEVKYGCELVESVQSEFLKDDTPNPFSKICERASMSTFLGERPDKYFISCFCEDGDLLSQWRGYAGTTNGYAIGFSTEYLLRERPKEFHLRRVIYDQREQRSIVKTIFKEVQKEYNQILSKANTLSLEKNSIDSDFSKMLQNTLRECICSFKNPAFKEENEYRIVYYVSSNKHPDVVNFRISGGMLIPYIPIGWRSSESKVPSITSITIGPNREAELSKKSLNLLLEKYNLEYVDVRESKIPFRT
jgi:hypothetical protein